MRAVLVTGSSSGIGRACALELSRHGFRTYAGVRSEADAQALRSLRGADLVPVILDVCDAGAVERVRSQLLGEVGEAGLFGLVSNAGISASGPVEFLDLDEIRRVFDVNVLGAVRLAQAFLPALRRSRGRIVHIGSGEAFLSTPANSAYCMSKHALLALGESLRMEVAPHGVRVIQVEPGGTETRIMDKVAARFERLGASLPPAALELYGDSMDARRRMPENRRLMPPETVARVVRRALSDAKPKARYFVGADVLGAFAAGRWLPAWARDAILRRALGFPRADRSR